MPSLPTVTLHFAQSLDGRLALEAAPALLSTAEGTAAAHKARAEHDAVLVGARTVTTDDPLLTVRALDGPQPHRVVLASSLAVPLSARLFDRNGPGGPVVVVGAEGRASREARGLLEERGAEIIVVPASDEGWVSLPHALAALRERGVRSLLVEGGARVLTSFLRARLAQRATIEIAMRLLGAPGLPSLGALGVTTLAQSVALARPSVEQAGENILVRGDVVYPG